MQRGCADFVSQVASNAVPAPRDSELADISPRRADEAQLEFVLVARRRQSRAE